MRRTVASLVLALCLCPVLADAGYTIDWELVDSVHAILGVAPVQDTLMWVSANGALHGDTTKTILVYDIRSMAMVDSFVTPWQGEEGYFDLTYYSDSDHVFCATPMSDTIDVLDATTHGLVRRFCCTGPQLCSDPSGVGCDGESLYVLSWSERLMFKTALDGSNCHRVCSVPAMWPHGIGMDRTRSEAYVTSYHWPPWPPCARMLSYDLAGLRLSDAWEPEEFRWMGGSDLWRDSCLLAVACRTPRYMDRVICFRLTHHPRDVAPTAVVAPDSVMWLDSIRPTVSVTNLGPAPIGDFPVYCWIDSAGARVYQDSGVCELTRPDGRCNVEFPGVWHPTQGATYGVIFVTALASDTNRTNDTLRYTVVVGIGEAPRLLLREDWLSVAPSPFRHSFAVRVPGLHGEKLSVELFDVAGKRVDMVVIPPGEAAARLPTPGRALCPGTYFLRVSADGKVAARRVVKVD